MRNIKRSACGCLVAMCLCYSFFLAERVLGNPTGPSVAAGQASVSGIGTSHVTVTQSSAKAIINWNSFNIASGEMTQFVQPSASAIALNRIGQNSPSIISGSLQANGVVMLLNSNGILFDAGAQVNVGGLVASNFHMTDTDFLAGQFKLAQLITNGVVQSVGDIRNRGTITAGEHGVYLLSANGVENSGIITSPNGSITLAAGNSVFLSNRPDGRGFLVELQAPAGQALNLGQLKADGGR